VDGEVGYVEDLLVDDVTWMTRYLVLDSRHWWPGRRALLTPEWVSLGSWMELAPEYDPARPVDRAYEARLLGHYGRPSGSSPDSHAA
jgi:hypothetical protein